MKRTIKLKRMLLRIFLRGMLCFMLISLILMAPALWNRWYVYPTLDQKRETFQDSYQNPVKLIPLTDFKGVLHSHTYWSHDSRGIMSEILPAAKEAGLDFMFLSDHKRSALDTFPRGYHGRFDDLLIEAGTESNQMMITPFRPGVLDWSEPQDSLIKRTVDQGGMALYVHSEEEHDWDNLDFQGMEIYNIHTDLKDESGLFSFLLNSLLTGMEYRDWAYRELYDDQTNIWALWDSLNRKRRIVGFAAVDAHNNQSLRARYLSDGQVEWVGPNAKTLSIDKADWLDKWMLGNPDSTEWDWSLELDPYVHSFQFVNTHILADSLDRFNLRDHLLAGHAYISFESLAPAEGFQFFYTNGHEQALGIMGDSLPYTDIGRLAALSPFPAQFHLYKDGIELDRQGPTYVYGFSPNEVGNYRLVLKISLDNQWLTWVMSNPIYLYDYSTP